MNLSQAGGQLGVARGGQPQTPAWGDGTLVVQTVCEIASALVKAVPPAGFEPVGLLRRGRLVYLQFLRFTSGFYASTRPAV